MAIAEEGIPQLLKIFEKLIIINPFICDFFKFFIDRTVAQSGSSLLYIQFLELSILETGFFTAVY